MTILPTLLLLAATTGATTSPTEPGAPGAAPAAPPPPSAARLAEFNRIDTNEDGRVSSSEHEVYARALFDRLDSNIDYKLTVAEIMATPKRFFRHVSAGVGGMFGGVALTLAEKIQRIDANRDGVVSRDEHADAARAKFREMDVNNNGELSPVEFAAGG
jgi:hypothetical protein